MDDKTLEKVKAIVAYHFNFIAEGLSLIPPTAAVVMRERDLCLREIEEAAKG